MGGTEHSRVARRRVLSVLLTLLGLVATGLVLFTAKQALTGLTFDDWDRPLTSYREPPKECIAHFGEIVAIGDGGGEPSTIEWLGDDEQLMQCVEAIESMPSIEIDIPENAAPERIVRFEVPSEDPLPSFEELGIVEECARHYTEGPNERPFGIDIATFEWIGTDEEYEACVVASGRIDPSDFPPPLGFIYQGVEIRNLRIEPLGSRE